MCIYVEVRTHARKYPLFVSKPSSILVIKVKYGDGSEDRKSERREKETVSRIHHDAVTKASADDTF